MDKEIFLLLIGDTIVCDVRSDIMLERCAPLAVHTIVHAIILRTDGLFVCCRGLAEAIASCGAAILYDRAAAR